MVLGHIGCSSHDFPHLRMPSSPALAITFPPSLVHAHTLRGFTFGISGFRGEVTMTFLVLGHMSCSSQDRIFEGCCGAAAGERDGAVDAAVYRAVWRCWGRILSTK